MTSEHHVQKLGDDSQPTLFDGPRPGTAEAALASSETSECRGPKKKVRRPRQDREDIRGIQDLLWKEALLAVQQVDQFESEEAFHERLLEMLPQNSKITRNRYAQTLMRLFFTDGVQGLAATIWRKYRDQNLEEEVLRYLYAKNEPMVGASIAEALFPIADNSVIPASYLTNFIRQRFGEETPDKSIARTKMNLRKLGVLAKSKGERDTLRPLAPSATGFLVILHFLFAQDEARGVEFRTLTENPFWKFLGFKNEDQIRTILKDAVNKGLIAKYVVADRIESISFRFTWSEFVAERRKL